MSAFGAVRSERYKLILQNDRQEFYDLDSDPNELNALDLVSLSGMEQDSYAERNAIAGQLVRSPLNQ